MQLLLSLVKPFKILLLDEVTTSLGELGAKRARGAHEAREAQGASAEKRLWSEPRAGRLACVLALRSALSASLLNETFSCRVVQRSCRRYAHRPHGSVHAMCRPFVLLVPSRRVHGPKGLSGGGRFEARLERMFPALSREMAPSRTAVKRVTSASWLMNRLVTAARRD